MIGMSILDVKAGKGISINDDGELGIDLDPEKDGDIKVSDNGVWAKGLKGLSNQFVDEWTITSSHTQEEEVYKNIWLNTRVATRCYCYCMFKAKRPFTGSKNFDKERNKRNAMYTIEPKNAVNGTNYDSEQAISSTNIPPPGDLKDVLDIIREVNFPIIYNSAKWDDEHPSPEEHDFEPPVILRPGSLIAFSDTIYCSDYYANAMYENGMRMPKLTTFNGYREGDTSQDTAGTVTSDQQPQHIYALFMVTNATYSTDNACDYEPALKPNENNTYQVNTAPYQILKYLKLKCIWSDQEAFDGLLSNAPGWRPGEFMNMYKRADYDSDTYSAGEPQVYGEFIQAVTYQDWAYVHTVFNNT
jgi:hypothetical protein